MQNIYTKLYDNKVVNYDFFFSLFASIGSDGKFIIDASTGETRTSLSPLDREEKSVYSLTAVATDRGNRQVRFAF